MKKQVQICQEEKLSSQINCILIRHGRTLRNQMNNQGKRQNQPRPSRNKEYWFNSSHIDGGLTEQGIKQALETKKLVSNEVQAVFVSPLERALQTANLIFGERKDIKIFVVPNLIAKFKHTASISLSIVSKKQKYPNMDFSFFDNLQPTWQTDHLREELASAVTELLAQNCSQSEDLLTEYYFNLVKLSYPDFLEEKKSFWRRVQRSLLEIRDHCQNLKHSNIAIVTHRGNYQRLSTILGLGEQRIKTGSAKQFKI